MPANTTTATNGHTAATERSKLSRGPTKSRKRSAAARSRRTKNASTRNSQMGTASRLMSQGKQALGSAYGWASESAGRALPRAARYVPDQGTMRNLMEERPLVLGAIGLGLGAIIGMMMPTRLMGGTSARRRRSQPKRKS